MAFRLFLLLMGINFVLILGKDKDKPKDKDAVILSEIMEITVEKESFEYTVSNKILIKNKKGLRYCSVTLIEDEFHEIENIDAVIKNIFGKTLKELDSDDIEEESISPGFIFYAGNTYHHFKLEHFTFPFIIEYSYKISCSSLFFWKDWYPQNSVPTLKSEYRLTIDSNVQFTTKEIGSIPEPIVTSDDEYKTYVWSLDSIKAIYSEDYMPPENKTQLALKFSPTYFEIADYKGSCTSWDSYANWYRNMTLDKYFLPQKAKNKIREAIVGIKDTSEIVYTLYKQLQDETRYVALEPGINGWQPHSATEVYEHHYGDCKDLSTYMVAMLDVAGIKAYPTLARTSSRGKHDSSFVVNIFNHCITMVPLKKDTIWLECTSSYADPKNMPQGIEDISVLVVEDSTSKFMTTPQKKSHQNYWKSKVSGVLGDFSKKLGFITKVYVGGNVKNYFKERLETSSTKDNLNYIKSRFGKYSANLKINDYSIEAEGNNFALKFTGYYKNLIKKSGKRVFMNLNLFNRETKADIPEEEIDEREFPIYYYYPYLDIDTVEVKLPKGYTLETKEGEKIIITSFSYYKSSIKNNNGKLLYIRELEIKENRINVDKYEEYKTFIENVAKADRKKIILKKK